MALSFKNTKDIEVPWTTWFLYGSSGSGKTTMASTFPRPIFLVPKTENSQLTLQGSDFAYIQILDVNSPLKNGAGGMISALTELESMYKANPGEFPFDTIVIESISHYSDLVIEHLTEGKLNVAMDQRRWGTFTSHFRNIHTRLRDMDIHAVYTALADLQEKDDGTVIGGPLLSGGSRLKLPAACDAFAYCTINQKNAVDYEYQTHFRKYKQFDARTRFKQIPPMVVNFDFQQIEPLLTAETSV